MFSESDGFSFPVNAETLAELERVTSEIRLSSRERGTDAGRARQRRRDDALLASQLSVHFQESEDASPSAPTTDSSNNRQQRHRCPALDAGASLATAVDLGARPEPAERQEGRRWESAHGEVEWGAPPKKDGFGVLFGVDDESDDGIGNAWSPASRAR